MAESKAFDPYLSVSSSALIRIDGGAGRYCVSNTTARKLAQVGAVFSKDSGCIS